MRYINRKIVVPLTVAVLMTMFSCAPRPSERAAIKRKPRATADSLTVFLTGGTLGKLKPCGCSGGQLGGLDRRPAVFDSVPADKRMLIDTGALIENTSDQELIKFDIILQALGLLNYDVVNLNKDDFEIARNRGSLGSSAVKFISAFGTGDEVAVGFQNRYMLNNEHVTISVFTVDIDKTSVDRIKKSFPPPEQGDKTFNIVILNRCDEDVVSSIAGLEIVDCIVCPSEAEEPMIIGSPNRRPLVFSVGRYGRFISSLRIEKARVRDRLKFKFKMIPVTEDLKPDPTLKELYRGYQQIVRDSKLLEKHPRYPLDDGLKYVGSESCKACHEPAYQKWKQTKHAKAYTALEEVGSQYDPECVLCHVVGLDYESGFVSEQKTPEMKNVGCENCHGPGSEHIKNPVQAKTKGPKSTCLDCHTPEQSGGYAGNEKVFEQKIIHWTEQNPPGNVK